MELAGQNKKALSLFLQRAGAPRQEECGGGPGRKRILREKLLTVKSQRESELASVGLQARNPREPTVTPTPNPAGGTTTIVDANTGKGALTNDFLTPSNRIRGPLSANVSVEFPDTVTIEGPGKVVLQSVVKVRYELLDRDTVKGYIYLDAGANSGTYLLG